jgi:phospholipid/cholesterol/gamma-HCH transport system substrate-binding protein
MTPAAPKKPAAPYDERVYRRGHPPHRATIALIAIVLLVIGTYFAWTKELPFQHPYELKAVFSNAVNIRAKSPVRIAGVNVGEVKSVKGVGNDAEVTFTVDDAGRPIHDDAEVEIRPRIFLEGNFFLDLRPGSPSAPELASGDTIPITHTSTAVQLDEVLTSLQKPDRANLVRLLKGFGTGLNHQPTAQEDVGQDTEVQGKSGAQAINQSFRYGGAAGRDTAIVSEALQGTAPHDLSRLLRSSGATFAALLTREQQLKDLVTNFNTTMSALASESDSLSAGVHELAPTLEIARPALLRLNNTLPALRAFARDITPGIKQIPATIKAANPWIKQAKPLLHKKELLGIAHNLQKAAPGLAKFTDGSIGLLPQVGLTSRCASGPLLNTGDVVINDQFNAGVPNFKEFLYGLVEFNGESQSFDGNGPYLRFQSGGGPTTVHMSNPAGDSQNNVAWGTQITAPTGTQPVLGSTPPYRTDVNCYTQPVPNLSTAPGNPGAVGAPTPSP